MFHSRFQRSSTSKFGQALDDDQLHRIAPSIFATTAHESRSERFAPVPTIEILNGLRAEGFDPVYAAQSRSRDASKRDFTKHMIRLRHRGDHASDVGDKVFEIILINANDGTSAYRMAPGVYRLVCKNGLMVGESYDEVRVRHSGNAIHEVIEGAFHVLQDRERVTGQVDEFQSIMLSPDERVIMAEAAHQLRFPDQADRPVGIKPLQLLDQRRVEDTTRNLWTTLNVLQENMIRGGQSGYVRDANNRRRRQTTREIQGIDQNRALNQALWTLTERMAQLKAK